MNALPQLHGEFVFLSASFPSGARAQRFPAADPAGIADAVSSLARAVFEADGRLVFGAHPTISPLVLQIAAELDKRARVDIYQSSWFEGQVPPETLRLVDQGYGRIVWTPADDSRDESLSTMRRRMLSEPIAGGVFVGGMEGVVDEHNLFASLHPAAPRLAFTAPGGAASTLQNESLPRSLSEALASARYPAAARAAVGFITGKG